MHMDEARAQRLDLTYTLFDLDSIEGGVAALPRILADVRDRGFLGVNITHPVKQAVLPLLDSRSDDVAALGACNTVVIRDGKYAGHNTDWTGFAENMRRGLPDVPLNHVMQIGAGGAGSAITYALLKLGVGRVSLIDLDADRAQGLANRFNAAFGAGRVVVTQSLADVLPGADGVVNCSPVGMAKYPGSPIPTALLRQGLWVADVVYVPLETQLLREAAEAGCRTLDGGGMAVFQAAEAFRLFTGTTPNRERMLARFAAM
jgi:shikimate dehydrogenase